MNTVEPLSARASGAEAERPLWRLGHMLDGATEAAPNSTALIVGGLFLFCVAFLQLLHFRDVLYNGTDRTRALEPLSLSAAAFALAALLPAEGLGTGAGTNDKLLLFGRIVFGISIVIFGIQHFMYAPFLATLVMPWLPGHLFWIYFTGASMVLAGLAIAIPVATLAAQSRAMNDFAVAHLP